MEELAEAERETRLGRFPGLVSSEPSERGVGLYLLGPKMLNRRFPTPFQHGLFTAPENKYFGDLLRKFFVLY